MTKRLQLLKSFSSTMGVMVQFCKECVRKMECDIKLILISQKKNYIQ